MTLFICNKDLNNFCTQLKKEVKGESSIISSETNLNKFIDGTNFNPDLIKHCFIYSGLTWNERDESNYYGFDIAKKLRAKKIRCIFYFFPPFLKIKKEEFGLSNFSLFQASYYHRLVELEMLAGEIKNLSGELMSYDLLDDINDTLLTPKAIVREILHDLKNKVVIGNGVSDQELKQTINKKVDKIFVELSLIISENRKELELLKEDFIEDMLDEVKINGRDASMKIVEDYTNRIISLAPDSDLDEENEIAFPKTRWKVLFVDDEEGVREKFEQGFKTNNISYELATNVEDALTILKEDSQRNLITVLVTDIRFKKEENSWDQLQGYDLLRISYFELNNFVSSFAITAARKRLYRLKQNNQFRVHTYYKDDIVNSEGAMNIFCQKVREEGNNTFFKSRSRPQSFSWSKKTNRFAAPLFHYYRAHLFSLDYDIKEEEINKEAREYVNALLKGEIEDRIKFTGTIKNDSPDSSEGLEKFRSRILVGRRIALALYLRHKIDETQIFYLMQDKKEEDINGEGIASSKKQLFNTSLALSFKNLSKMEDSKSRISDTPDLLEEEMEWLKKEYKYIFDIDEIRRRNIELEVIIKRLDDIQHTIGKLKLSDEKVKKIQDSFLHVDFTKPISTQKIISQFPKILKLNILCGNQLKLYNSIDKEDIDFFERKEFRDFLIKVSTK